MRTLVRMTLCGLLLAQSVLCGAQGFDDLKKAKPVQLNAKLQSLLDKNDVKGLERMLKSRSDAKNEGSNMGKNDKGAPLVVPLLYDVVDRTLKGSVSVDMCRVALDAGCDVYTIFNGKTPIYRIMDYLATTPSARAGVGMEVLSLLLDKKEFDINRRYRSLPPPFSYLLSENYKYLGDRYSKDYLSSELIRTLLEHGAALNTYDENGASLLLLANTTENRYLQEYLVKKGINIDKAADETGNNAVYAAIANSDVNLLRLIVDKNQLALKTGAVKDRLAGVSSEMYGYLAGECARNLNSSSYEDIMEFRGVFKEKQALVQSKYEALARKETAAADSYESIQACIGRYPDLGAITGPRKRQIAENESRAARSFDDFATFRAHYPEYGDIVNRCRDQVAAAELESSHDIAEIKAFESHYPDLKSRIEEKKQRQYAQDCQLIRNIHSHATQNLQNHRLDDSSLDFTTSFVEGYDGFYDPDTVIPLAKALKKHLSVVHVAGNTFGPYYTPNNSFENRYRSDLSTIEDAIRSAQAGSEYQLVSEWLTGRLQQKKSDLTAHYNDCVAAVDHVNKISLDEIRAPRRRDDNGKSRTFYYDGFSFTVTDYSKDTYDHYVVHAMKGGKLEGFVAGYGSMLDAFAAGYCAAVYGFARTVGPPVHHSGLLTSVIDNQQMKWDIYNAKEDDRLSGIIESWFE